MHYLEAAKSLDILSLHHEITGNAGSEWKCTARGREPLEMYHLEAAKSLDILGLHHEITGNAGSERKCTATGMESLEMYHPEAGTLATPPLVVHYQGRGDVEGTCIETPQSFASSILCPSFETRKVFQNLRKTNERDRAKTMHGSGSCRGFPQRAT